MLIMVNTSVLSDLDFSSADQRRRKLRKC